MTPPARPPPRSRPAATVSAASSAGVRDCLTPHLDRRQVFEEEFRAQQLHQSARLKRGHGLPPDPGFAFGVSSHGNQTSVKALLCPSSSSSTAHAESPESSPRPRRHSQGLRLPPTYVFGRGKHEGQYKGAASDGVAGALSYVGGGGVLERSSPQHGHDTTPDLVFGLRSRRDEEGSMKACLQGVYAEKGDPEAEQRREDQAERQLAAAAAALGGRGRARAAAEGTAAQLLAPEAVGLVAADDSDEYLRPRSKGDIRRIFLQRLGPQCGLGSEEAFERVFARAAAGGGMKDGAALRCSIYAFRAALDAEQRGGRAVVGGAGLNGI